ncbi:hypothetical protein HYPSUDRAFT_1072412 [Hypholoma sublateritium FD-334 SS-4]|uniref:Uncharacterized protein n=1 Tax=Hypholoma sublateritium (strain FD-334 SS-4) TaxID=945553 RepID=A0A0D2LCV1_HYPSF|nr:hypothetical protein HYPSUDRAFT_1072412 [Hypholoma sublateritium FD-334 SS-4]
MLQRPRQPSTARGVRHTPVQNLPHELLERIFYVITRLPRTLPVDEKYPYRPLFSKMPYFPPNSIMILSQVCIRWRETLLQMPVVWSFIHLTRSLESHRRLRSNLGRSLDWLSTYLTRSRDFPLHITLDTTRLPIDATLSLISPHSARWSTFTLFVSHIGSLPLALPSLVHTRLPRLQSLSITSDIYREGIVCYDPLLPFFVTGTPQLTNIRLTGVYVSWNALPLANLRILELHFTSRWPDFIALRNMFNSSPRLRRLVIHDDIASILRHVNQPLDNPTVSLARLKHLEIEVYRNRDERADVVGLLGLFSLPSLQVLVIKAVKIGEWIQITENYALPVEAFPNYDHADSRRSLRDRHTVRRLPHSFPFLSALTVTSALVTPRAGRSQFG